MGSSSNFSSIPSDLAWIAWFYPVNKLFGVQWEVLAEPMQTIWVSSLALSFPGFFSTFDCLWLPWILYSSSLNHNNCVFSIRILAPPWYTLEPVFWLEVIKIKTPWVLSSPHYMSVPQIFPAFGCSQCLQAIMFFPLFNIVSKIYSCYLWKGWFESLLGLHRTWNFSEK